MGNESISLVCEAVTDENSQRRIYAVSTTEITLKLFSNEKSNTYHLKAGENTIIF